MPVESVEAFQSALAGLDGDASAVRLSVTVAPWLESLRIAEEKRQLRRDYEQKVQGGEYPAHETLVGINKLVQEYGIAVAIHNHGRGKGDYDWRTSLTTDWRASFTIRPPRSPANPGGASLRDDARARGRAAAGRRAGA